MSQKWRKYPPEFRLEALNRMKTCASVSKLARELGLNRKFLYLWKQRAEESTVEDAKTGQPTVQTEAGSPVEQSLRRRVQELESLTARQSLELDFFKGALQRVEERRRKSGQTSEPGSTTKSGKSLRGKAI